MKGSRFVVPAAVSLATGLLLIVATARAQVWTYVELTRIDTSSAQTSRLWMRSPDAVLEVVTEDGGIVERRSCLDGVLLIEDGSQTTTERRDLSVEACTNYVTDAVYGVWRFVSTAGIAPSPSSSDSNRAPVVYTMPSSYELYATVSLDPTTHVPVAATLRSGEEISWVSVPRREVDAPPSIMPGPASDVYERLEPALAAEAFGRPIPSTIGEFVLTDSQKVTFASRPERPLYGVTWRNPAGQELQAMVDSGMAEAATDVGLNLSDPAMASSRMVEGPDVLTLVAPDFESLTLLTKAIRPGATIVAP